MKLRGIIATILLVALFAVPAYARKNTDDLNIKIDIQGGWNAFYYNANETTGDKKTGNKNGLFNNVSSQSNIRGIFEWNDLTVVARIKANSKFVSELYSTYKYENGGTLLLGLAPNLAYHNFAQFTMGMYLINYGTISDNSRGQVRWSQNNYNVALVVPTAPTDAAKGDDTAIKEILDYSVTGAAYSTSSIYRSIPRIEASYDIKNDMFNGKAFASYALFLYDSKIAATGTEDTNFAQAFTLGYGGKFKFGKLTIDSTVWGGMNLYLTGHLYDGITSASVAKPKVVQKGDGVEIQNVISAGAGVEFGYPLEMGITPHLGMGYMSSMHSDDADTKADSFGVYANFTLFANKYFLFAPEISYNYDVTTGKGKSTVVNDNFWAGVKFFFLL